MSAQPAHSYESPSIECQEVQKSPDFWFKGGNFVLVASHKVAYRVHGDVLGRKSKVFRDLLNLDEVSRPRSEDTMDGCPVVHITESPDDVNTFLSLIYDGLGYLHRYIQEPRWAMAKIMMLLADKYDVPEVREEGLRELRAWYATDIDTWDKHDQKFFASDSDHLSVASITHTLQDNESRLHALVLYYCCRLPISHLLAGDPATGCPPLCPEDLTRTLKFKESMPKYWHDFLTGSSADIFRDVQQCKTCGYHHSEIQSMFARFIQARLHTDAYKFIDLAVWTPMAAEARGRSFCDRCIMSYEFRLRNVRQTSLSHIDGWLVCT